MLSMIISLFENMDGAAMPDTLSALYAQASSPCLTTQRPGPSSDDGQASSSAIPHLDSSSKRFSFVHT